MLRLLLILALCLPASAAFSKTYSYTIGASVVTSGPHADFPIYITITDNGLRSTGNGGVVTDAQGDDVCFYADSGLATLLKWELVSWDAATGNVVAWVKIPSLENSGVIYIGAGDATITSYQGDAVNVWTNGFAAVYHLDDSLADATGTWGLTVNTGSYAAGKLGNGINTVAASSQLFRNTSNGPGYGGTSPITVSMWVNADILSGAFHGRSSEIILRFSGSNLEFILNSFATNDRVAAAHGMSTGTWYYLAGTYDSTNGIQVWRNGTSLASIMPTGTYASVATAQITFANFAGGSYFDGTIDEPRLATVARSSGWLTTEYTNQNDPATFGTLSEITPGGSRRVIIIN